MGVMFWKGVDITWDFGIEEILDRNGLNARRGEKDVCGGWAESTFDGRGYSTRRRMMGCRENRKIMSSPLMGGRMMNSVGVSLKAQGTLQLLKEGR